MTCICGRCWESRQNLDVISVVCIQLLLSTYCSSFGEIARLELTLSIELYNVTSSPLHSGLSSSLRQDTTAHVEHFSCMVEYQLPSRSEWLCLV